MLDKRYRQIIEQVEDHAIFTLDNEGNITTWNRGAERVLGFSEEEALGQPGAFIFTPEDRERGVPEREFERARYEGKASDDRWHLRKDGSRFYANGVLTTLHDSVGTPDGFVKILRNFTQQRKAEEERTLLLRELHAANEKLEAFNERLEHLIAERTKELSRALERLTRSEQRFSQAFNVGPVAACITTIDEDRFLDVNKSFLELTGYGREEVLGRSLLDLGMWSSEGDKVKLKHAERTMGSFRNLELQLKNKEGMILDILSFGEVIGLNGEQGYLKMFYDITERKRTEEQFMQAIQQVMSDTAWFSQQVLERLAGVRVGDKNLSSSIDLTKRERQVLEHLAAGQSNQQIAKKLGLAVQTVRNYVAMIYDKLGVSSRAEAVVWARERGISL